MPVITEPHDSDYEPVEEEEKGSRGSRAGSVISSVAFGPLKTMIKNGFNRLLGTSFFAYISFLQLSLT